MGAGHPETSCLSCTSSCTFLQAPLQRQPTASQLAFCEPILCMQACNLSQSLLRSAPRFLQQILVICEMDLFWHSVLHQSAGAKNALHELICPADRRKPTVTVKREACRHCLNQLQDLVARYAKAEVWKCLFSFVNCKIINQLVLSCGNKVIQSHRIWFVRGILRHRPENGMNLFIPTETVRPFQAKAALSHHLNERCNLPKSRSSCRHH